MKPLMCSGFADEAASDLETQIECLISAGIEGLDVRSVDGTNVLDLTDSRLEAIRTQCQDRGLHVQCVGSPVNKVEFSAPNQTIHMEKLRRAIHAAHHLGTNRIRLFSPIASWNDREGVLDWMEQMGELASESNLLLLHENDGHFFGAYPQHEKWLFEQMRARNFKAAFDFSNAVMLGYDPVEAFLPWILPYLDTLHMKDYSRKEERVVPCGEGDGRIQEFLRAIRLQGWEGTISLEPHLQVAGEMGGWTGPELFSRAAKKMHEVAFLSDQKES